LPCYGQGANKVNHTGKEEKFPSKRIDAAGKNRDVGQRKKMRACTKKKRSDHNSASSKKEEMVGDKESF